jgi:chromatin remodeling complex protein RSC6
MEDTYDQLLDMMTDMTHALDPKMHDEDCDCDLCPPQIRTVADIAALAKWHKENKQS